MPCFVGKAILILLAIRIFVITPREPFVMPFYTSIIFVRNMILAPSLQITTSRKFIPLLNILEHKVLVSRLLFL